MSALGVVVGLSLGAASVERVMLGDGCPLTPSRGCTAPAKSLTRGAPREVSLCGPCVVLVCPSSACKLPGTALCCRQLRWACACAVVPCLVLLQGMRSCVETAGPRSDDGGRFFSARCCTLTTQLPATLVAPIRVTCRGSAYTVAVVMTDDCGRACAGLKSLPPVQARPDY